MLSFDLPDLDEHRRLYQGASEPAEFSSDRDRTFGSNEITDDRDFAPCFATASCVDMQRLDQSDVRALGRAHVPPDFQFWSRYNVAFHRHGGRIVVVDLDASLGIHRRG